jgi:hypothetical protein
MYNTFMVTILEFFIRENSDMSPRTSTILQMLVTVLIFTPVQLLMFVPKILYATGVLTEKKQIVLNRGGTGKTPQSNTSKDEAAKEPTSTQGGQESGKDGTAVFMSRESKTRDSKTRDSINIKH